MPREKNYCSSIIIIKKLLNPPKIVINITIIEIITHQNSITMKKIKNLSKFNPDNVVIIIIKKMIVLNVIL